MTELLVWAFAFICFGLLFWGLIYRARVYQYPFFMGATFTGFIFPQAIALANDDSLPERAVQRILVMACLCSAMCWLGYQIPIPLTWKNPVSPLFDSKRLRIGALIYIGIGLAFWTVIYSLPQGRALSGFSTGIITVYFFFADFLTIGFSIILLETLRKPKLLNILIFLVSILIPLYRIVFFGRREETVFVALSLALGFYFTRRQVVNSWLVIVSIFLATIITFNIGEYRNAIVTGNWDNFNPISNVASILKAEKSIPDSELRNAAFIVDSTVESARYGWGSGYWDRLIFRWVPSQFLGSDFKSRLQFSLATTLKSQDLYEVYGYQPTSGSTSTGLGDAFAEFDYIGSLIFALLAMFFKFLWCRAVYGGSLPAQLAYIVLSVKAMLAITHNTGDFLSDLLYLALFLTPLLLWSYKSQRVTEDLVT